jgi:hypothetical protein
MATHAVAGHEVTSEVFIGGHVLHGALGTTGSLGGTIALRAVVIGVIAVVTTCTGRCSDTTHKRGGEYAAKVRAVGSGHGMYAHLQPRACAC